MSFHDKLHFGKSIKKTIVSGAYSEESGFYRLINIFGELVTLGVYIMTFKQHIFLIFFFT
jgi:hypothetical protein